jgi:hypothetical protein
VVCPQKCRPISFSVLLACLSSFILVGAHTIRVQSIDNYTDFNDLIGRTAVSCGARHSDRKIIGGRPCAKARQAADKLRRVVAGGINPVESKRRAKAEGLQRTFAVLAERYLEEHARRHKRSAEADERNLRLHILPKWRDWPFDSIRRSDVIELAEGLIKQGSPVQANRIQALVSSIFSFALDADLVQGNPCARLRKRGAETTGTRVLSDGEIQLFWPNAILPPVSRRVGLALRLAFCECRQLWSPNSEGRYA